MPGQELLDVEEGRPVGILLPDLGGHMPGQEVLDVEEGRPVGILLLDLGGHMPGQELLDVKEGRPVGRLPGPALEDELEQLPRLLQLLRGAGHHLSVVNIEVLLVKQDNHGYKSLQQNKGNINSDFKMG